MSLTNRETEGITTMFKATLIYAAIIATIGYGALSSALTAIGA